MPARKKEEHDEPQMSAYEAECARRVAAGLPVDPPEPDLPGYPENHPPAEPDLSEPGQDVDNRTRDGMQVPEDADVA